MKSPRDFWNTIELAPDMLAVAADWRLAMGQHFEIGRVFLTPASRSPTGRYPCPRCGLPLRVHRTGPDQIVAEHDDDAPDCPTLRDLKDADLSFLRMDWPRLTGAIFSALGLKPIRHTPEGNWAEPWAELMCGRSRLPVYLVFSWTLPHFSWALNHLPAAGQQPSLLLSISFDMAFQQLGASRGALALALCDHLDLKNGGKFTASKAALDEIEVFRQRHTPQEAPPPDQSVVATALQLATALDSDPRLKAPTHMTVFQLFCVKGLSWSQIEKQAPCAHATLMARKKRLEDTLKAPLESFRIHSDALASMFAAMKSPKAKRINPKAAIYDDAGFDQP